MKKFEKNSDTILAWIARLLFITAGCIAGFLIMRLFISSYTVRGYSMNPQFNDRDKILILKHTACDIGDVVVIKSPAENNRFLLRRIIANEGDVIEIRNKTFYINEKKFNFPWPLLNTDQRNLPMDFTLRDTMPAIKLSRHQFFVISDNLKTDFDSRRFGAIENNMIIGKILYKL